MTHEDLQSLLGQAEEYETQLNYEETERCAQQVLSELSSALPAAESHIALGLLHAKAKRLLGVVSSRRGDYLKALEYFEEALTASKKVSDQSVESIVLGNIGVTYMYLSDYSQALEYSGKALSIAEELGDVASIGKHIGNIGGVYLYLSDYPKALEYYRKALDLAEVLNDKAAVASHLGNIGIVHWGLSDYSKAQDYYAKALSISEELGNKLRESHHLGNLGLVHMNLSDYPKALENYAKALAIAEELGNKAGIALWLSNIGSVHLHLSDYPMALEYYSRALDLAEKLNDKASVANILGNIGKVQQSLGDYSSALRYLGENLVMAEELGNKAGIASQLGNIGYVHASLSDYPKALEYLDKALGIAEELGNKAGVAKWLGNIGSVHMKLGDYLRAVECMERALSFNVELGMKSEVGIMKTMLGELYASQSNPERDESKAEVYLLESIAASEELGTRKYEAHKTLADLYEKQRRWEESHYHLRNYLRLKEEVQSEDARKKAQLMEQQKQIAEREKEIAIAKAAADAQMSATTTLLYKVLPQTIATRLIKGEKVADYFRDVSVLFADIVGFTPIASRMPARAVLAFLNYVFGEFDRIMERNGCEKIKTIGDGYLAVAGAPLECSDHAERITRAALEMMGDIILPDEIRKTIPKGAEFSIRIGIHMGPCFAGIVGENRFVYDIYSDAVNIAARMESHGEAGKIHVSDEFCFHLQNRMEATGEDFGGIRFDEREEMEIKGKGMMRTYFLERA